jgi:hypothetical protein
LRHGPAADQALRWAALSEAVQLLLLPYARSSRRDGQARRRSRDLRGGALSTYQFNTMSAEHHFCSKCGIYTHHRRRSNPNEYGVNVAILEGVSPFDFPEVPVTDGINHPSDGRSGSGIVGTLRFVPAH